MRVNERTNARMNMDAFLYSLLLTLDVLEKS